MDDQVISIFLMTLHLFISMKKASLFHSFSCINGITLGTNQLPGPLGFHTFSVWTIMLFAHYCCCFRFKVYENLLFRNRLSFRAINRSDKLGCHLVQCRQSTGSFGYCGGRAQNIFLKKSLLLLSHQEFEELSRCVSFGTCPLFERRSGTKIVAAPLLHRGEPSAPVLSSQSDITSFSHLGHSATVFPLQIGIFLKKRPPLQD